MGHFFFTKLNLIHQLTDSTEPEPSYQHKDPPQGRPSYGANIARRGVEISGGRKKLLEILYNVMEEPLGYDRRAYSTGLLR